MRINGRTAVVVAAASALAIAVPAAAHPGPSPKSSSHSPSSHKCKPHKAAYIVYGTLDSSQGAITVTNGKIASGTLVLDLTRTNHWAKRDKTATQPVSYQLGPSTGVKFDGGTTGFAAGERVKLIGKAPVITNKHCTNAGSVGTPTIRMIVVRPAAS